MTIKKIGILTGGGDCPGLNSVLYGAMLKAFDEEIECIGISKGWKGFMENLTTPLNIADHDDLHTVGGTLLYTSRTNPFKELQDINDEEKKEERKKEIAHEMSKHFDELGIDALIAIGGDDTLGVADALYKYTNAKVVGCPKTIDNDLMGTHYTFGFWSAVQLASNAMDNLTTTARSHQRVFIVEIMGRDAGFLTMYSGISSGADIILIPETPFDLEDDVIEVLKRRANSGHKYHIIACSEGAYPSNDSLNRDFQTISKETIEKLPKDPFGNPILPKLNMSKILAKELDLREDLRDVFKENGVDLEVRSVVLGHTMRAGTPNAFDRILGLRFGLAAVKLILNGEFGNMVSLQGNQILTVPFDEGVKKKYISAESDKIELRDLMVEIRYKAREIQQ
ncbi:MAG: ATP-dependent 6-phosphofructokinase [Candidatus Lokiarchaeota archaeon]|nr:ATP-dependent 6-phosphofructokinase [Candidatus Lokiarchaeota archaeon]MBD3199349.1 ATP-dependent 6-phosphofructokinase [Candidatus Lokiarchaeota archaeon]